MDNLDKVSAAQTWFDAFIKHGSSISVLLALTFGWGFSIFLSFPIHRYVKDDELATFYSRTLCILGSFAIAAATWPNDFRWSWAATMAVLSPLIGLLLLLRMKKWMPDLYEVLSMKKLTPAKPVTETNNEVEHDVRPTEPRSDTD